MKHFEMRQPYLDTIDNGGGTFDLVDETADTFGFDESVEETIPTEEPQAGELAPEPYKFKVKFNHDEMELAEDEAIPLIQKGMNYDKLQEKFNAIQTDPRFDKYEKVNQVSQLLGYQTDDELIDALYNTYYESTAESQGLTPEQIRKDYELQQREREIERKNQTVTQTQKDNAMYERFLKDYPGITVDNIKPETWQKVKDGMDLTTAYTQQRNQELETKLKTLEQNAENSKKAPVGGITTHGSQPTNIDPFEMGFNSI